MRANTTLIKLGGSVITFKDRPLSVNLKAIRNISHALLQLKTPLVLVHGGGSFGHYWSTKYGMHTKPYRYDSHGISIVHESMIALNQIIANSMIKNGMNPYSIMPSIFMQGQEPISAKITEINTIAESGIIPVTFGDIVHVNKGKYSILSGDSLMTIIAKVLKPSRVIFTLKVDGLYTDMKSQKLIHVVSPEDNSIEFSKVLSDVTGGMRRKVTEAFKIAALGIDVLMINGLKPDRIIDAVMDRNFVGTRVSSNKRRSVPYFV